METLETRRRRRSVAAQRGQALAVIIVMMSAIIGLTALAIDAGYIYAETRRAQNAADAAALSATTHLRMASNDCSDSSTQTAIQQVATSYLLQNGYNTSTDSTIGIVVTCPYNLDSTSISTTVRVQVSIRLSSFFSGMAFGAYFNPNTFAVGRVVQLSPPAPFMALGTGCASASGIESSGTGNVTVNGGSIHSNSSCSSSPYSIRTTGNGDVLSAAAISAVGSCYESPSGDISPNCTTGAPVQPDPISSTLRSSTPCNPLSGCSDFTYTSTGSRGDYNGSGSSNLYSPSGGGSDPQRVIGPGVYYGIRMSGNGTLWLRPGIYVIKGGGITWSGGTNLKICRGNAGEPTSTNPRNEANYGGSSGCDSVTSSTAGVLIFNTVRDYPTYGSGCPGGTADNIDLTGNGTLDLAPLATGTYAGLAIWQDRCVNNQTLSIGGTGSIVSLGGTIYVPNDEVELKGTGSITSTGSFYAENFDVGGTGSVTINYNSSTSFRARVAALIR